MSEKKLEELYSSIFSAFNDHNSEHFITVNIILAFFTVISILSLILETVPSLEHLAYIFTLVEWVSVVVFTGEYVIRIASSKKRSDYVFGFWGMADLLAILPTFIGLGNWTSLKSVRILRILRLLRILRIAKISRAYLQSHDQAKSEKEYNSINTVIYFLALISATVVLGAGLYTFEHMQIAYATIPLAMLQAAKILLGGPGQVAPITFEGEVVMIGGRFIGLALFGLLISIIGSTLHTILFGKSSSE